MQPSHPREMSRAGNTPLHASGAIANFREANVNLRALVFGFEIKQNGNRNVPDTYTKRK